MSAWVFLVLDCAAACFFSCPFAYMTVVEVLFHLWWHVLPALLGKMRENLASPYYQFLD